MQRSDPRWLELYDRIEQQVALERIQVDLGGQIVDWYRVADPEELLTAAVEDSVGRSTGSSAAEIDPFWAATWRPASWMNTACSNSVADRGRQELELLSAVHKSL